MKRFEFLFKLLCLSWFDANARFCRENWSSERARAFIDCDIPRSWLFIYQGENLNLKTGPSAKHILWWYNAILIHYGAMETKMMMMMTTVASVSDNRLFLLFSFFSWLVNCVFPFGSVDVVRNKRIFRFHCFVGWFDNIQGTEEKSSTHARGNTSLVAIWLAVGKPWNRVHVSSFTIANTPI